MPFIPMIVSLLLGLFIFTIPVLGKVFAETNTLVHEAAHALMALITGGRVYSISLFANTTGVTKTQTGSWVSEWLTSMAGYVAPPLFVYLSVKYLLFIRPRWILFILGIIAIFVTIIWVINFLRIKPLLKWIFSVTFYGVSWIIQLLFQNQTGRVKSADKIKKASEETEKNFYGLSWLIFFMIFIGTFIFIKKPDITLDVSIFLLGIIFEESIRSALIVMKMSYKKPYESGDAHNLEKTTKIIPAFVWGTLFFLQSLYFGYLTVMTVIKITI